MPGISRLSSLSPKLYYGWRITAASFAVLFVVVGIVYYSFPVFYAPLIDEFAWTRAQVTAGFFYSILIVGPIFGISAGFLIDRYGTRRILLAGLIAAGVGFLGFSGMHSLGAYYLFYFMETVGYVSGGPVPNQVLVSHWFNRMRGRAMGLAYVGIGVGGAVAPVLAQYLIRHAGWRTAMAVFGGAIFLLLVPLVLLVVRNRPEELGLHPDGVPSAAAASPAVPAPKVISLRHAMREPSFWLILAGSAMSIGAVGGVIQHLQLFLRDQKFTPEMAARVASLLLVSSIVGRVIMGYLADRFHKKYVMVAAYLLVGLSIPALYYVDTPGTIHLFALTFGFGMGADYMLIPLMTAHCFGVASLGKLMGVILTTDAVSQAFTPVLVGRLFDLHGSYRWGFAVLIVMSLLGALAGALIPRRPQVE
jgi:MFS family permease